MGRCAATAGTQQSYGNAPIQPYGQAPGADQGGIMAQGGLRPFAGLCRCPCPASGPTTRNALMTMLLPVGCVFGGVVISIIFGIIAGVTGVAAIGMIGGLLSLVAMLGGARSSGSRRS